MAMFRFPLLHLSDQIIGIIQGEPGIFRGLPEELDAHPTIVGAAGNYLDGRKHPFCFFLFRQKRHVPVSVPGNGAFRQRKGFRAVRQYFPLNVHARYQLTGFVLDFGMAVYGLRIPLELFPDGIDPGIQFRFG